MIFFMFIGAMKLVGRLFVFILLLGTSLACFPDSAKGRRKTRRSYRLALLAGRLARRWLMGRDSGLF
jgi:hypothetical protein